jgi:ParB/RepB/Spo0J family partition protein
MKVQKQSPKVRTPIRMLPIDRLVPTPDNRRRPITQASVESLAKSLAKDGVIQPIVVREHPEKAGRWEIRAGERRWRAAKLAGLTHMPAIIRKLDDESALSVTIAENLQRENPHPLELAATTQQAFDRGYDIKAVSARLGKTERAVTRLASLSRLSKAWRDEVLKPDSDAARLSVAHLELIARLPEESQQVLAEDEFCRVFARGFPTVEELRRLIDGGLRSLKAMPWALDDETLDPKAGCCLNCPKRSGMHPMLFEPEDAPQNGKVSKTDRCLDPACFDRKHAGFLERRESELRAQHPSLRLVQIGFDGLGPTLREKFGGRVTQVYQPKVVKATAPGATPAMQIDGPKAGALMHIDFGDATSRNGSAHKAARPRDEQGKPVPMPLPERKARLQKRRDAYLVSKVGESIRALTPEALTKTVANLHARTDEAAKRFDPLALVLAFGTSSRSDRDHDDSPWKRYDQLRERKGALPLVTALHEVVQVWTRRLGGSDTHFVTEQAQDARRIGELLGIDLKAIEAEAAHAIPTPKSWDSLGDKTPALTEEPPFDVTPSTTRPVAPTKTTRRSKRRKARR